MPDTLTSVEWPSRAVSPEQFVELGKYLTQPAAQTMFDKVKDSGQRQAFDTGAVRDIQSGKGRFDLISPLAMLRLAKHMENGCAKYGERNYEKGIPLMRYVDSAVRHIYAHVAGDRSEDHLAAAAWNMMSMMHTEEAIQRGILPATLDDRPNYNGEHLAVATIGTTKLETSVVYSRDLHFSNANDTVGKV